MFHTNAVSICTMTRPFLQDETAPILLLLFVVDLGFMFSHWRPGSRRQLEAGVLTERAQPKLVYDRKAIYICICCWRVKQAPYLLIHSLFIISFRPDSCWLMIEMGLMGKRFRRRMPLAACACFAVDEILWHKIQDTVCICVCVCVSY